MTQEIVFIFDLDGTLVDSKFQIASCLNIAREDAGFRNLDEKKVFDLIGLPVEALFDDLQISRQEIQKIVVHFRELLEKKVGEDTPVFPGVNEFLSHSKLIGIGVAVATSKPHYLAIKTINNSKLFGLVDFIQGIDGFPGKPNPAVILRCMDAIPAKRYVMFGDRIEDIQAANYAGIESVGIAQGAHSKEQLISAGCKLVVKDFIELNNIFDRI